MNNGLLGISGNRKARLSLGRRRLAGYSLVYWRNIPSWATKLVLLVDTVAHSGGVATYYVRTGKGPTANAGGFYNNVISSLASASLSSTLDGTGVPIHNVGAGPFLFGITEIMKYDTGLAGRYLVRSQISRNEILQTVTTGLLVTGQPDLKINNLQFICSGAVMNNGTAELFVENDEI